MIRITCRVSRDTHVACQTKNSLLSIFLSLSMRFAVHSDRAPLARYATPFGNCYMRRGSAAVRGTEPDNDRRQAQDVSRAAFNVRRETHVACQFIILRRRPNPSASIIRPSTRISRPSGRPVRHSTIRRCYIPTSSSESRARSASRRRPVALVCPTI